MSLRRRCCTALGAGLRRLAGVLDPQERPTGGAPVAVREDAGPPIGVGASGEHAARRLDLIGAPEHWVQLVRGAAPPGPVPPPAPDAAAADGPLAAGVVRLPGDGPAPVDEAPPVGAVRPPVDGPAPVAEPAPLSVPDGTVTRPPDAHRAAESSGATVRAAPRAGSPGARTRPAGTAAGQRHGRVVRSAADVGVTGPGAALGPADPLGPADALGREPTVPVGWVPPASAPVSPVLHLGRSAEGPRNGGRTTTGPVDGQAAPSLRPAGEPSLQLPQATAPVTGPVPVPAAGADVPGKRPSEPRRGARGGGPGTARLLLHAVPVAPRGAPVSSPRQPPSRPAPVPQDPVEGPVRAAAPAASRPVHDPAASDAPAGLCRTPSEPVRPSGRRAGAPAPAVLLPAPAGDRPQTVPGPAARDRWPDLPHRPPPTAHSEMTALTSMLSRLARIEDEQVAG